MDIERRDAARTSAPVSLRSRRGAFVERRLIARADHAASGSEGSGFSFATRPWMLAAIHLAVTTALLVPMAQLPAVETGVEIPWPLMAVLFAAVELGSVQLRLGRHPVTIVLRDLPLVLGLFFVSPVPLVVAHVVGVGAAFVARQSRILDAALGLVGIALATVVSIIVFRAVLSGGPPILFRSWTAVLLAAIAASAVINAVDAARRAAITGETTPGDLPHALAFGALAALVDASLGLAVVGFLRTDAADLGLLAAPVLVGVLAYRAALAQRRRQAGLEFLYESSRLLHKPLTGPGALEPLLRAIRAMFHADLVEAVLLDTGGRHALRAALGPGESATALAPASAQRVDEILSRLPVEGGRILPVTTGWTKHRPLPGLEPRGDAMLVPLRGSSGLLGTFLVANRAGQGVAFDRNDLQILESLGANTGVALENAHLLERLEASLAGVTQLAALVTSTSDAVISVSARGAITSWNPAAERLFGYRAGEVLGRRAIRLVPRDRRDELVLALVRVRGGAQVRDLQLDAIRRDGRRVPVSATVSPIVDQDGAVTGISAIIRDETERRRADAALRVTVDRFRGVFQGSPVGMGLVGPGLRWIRVNEAFCRMVGRQEDELVGSLAGATLHDEDHAAVEDLLGRVMSGAWPGSTVNARFVGPDDRVTWAKITTRPLHDAGTRSLHALCVIEDVTERRHAEDRARETESRLQRAILAFTAVREPAGVLHEVLTAARDITSAEYAAIAVLGDDGRVVADLIVDGDASFALAPGAPAAAEDTPPRDVIVSAEALTTRVPVDRHPVRLGAGELAETSGAAPGAPALRSFLGVPILFEGRLLATLCLWNRRDAEVFDQDDEKVAVALAAQAAVSLENARIHDRDLALVRDLDRANADLKRANTARSAFLASVSHELRTPLHSILAAAELVHDPLFGPLPERRVRELGSTIQSSGRHLLHLIDDLVDLSRIEAGGLELRPVEVSLGAILTEINAEIAPLAAEKAIALRVPRGRGPVVVADPLRLRQVLLNLLANAVKFTGRGGRIRVEVQQAASGTTIAVHDTGIGIAPADLERAFLPFEQVSGTSSPGAGLGLAISRRIMELHGGRLTVASQIDRGSIFTVHLPAGAAPSADAGRPQRAPAIALPRRAGAGRRILLVEDDATALDLVAEVLERGGFVVSRAASVEAALHSLDECRPEIVLLDLRLGDEDGLVVARHMRAAPDTTAIPILALTAGAKPEDPARARSAGCDAYVTKPVGARELLGHVHELLASGRAGADRPGRRRRRRAAAGAGAMAATAARAAAPVAAPEMLRAVGAEVSGPSGSPASSPAGPAGAVDAAGHEPRAAAGAAGGPAEEPVAAAV